MGEWIIKQQIKFLGVMVSVTLLTIPMAINFSFVSERCREISIKLAFRVSYIEERVFSYRIVESKSQYLSILRIINLLWCVRESEKSKTAIVEIGKLELA